MAAEGQHNGEAARAATEREDALSIKVLLIGTGLSVALTVLFAWYAGYLSWFGSSQVFFSTYDSTGYRRIGDHLATLGETRTPTHGVVALRPFLFPLYVSLYRFVGIEAMHGFQVLLNGLTLCFVYAALVNLRAHRALALAATGVLALVPSFQFLAFHALSETLATTLVAAALYAASRAAVAGARLGNPLGAAAVLMTCGMLVKPALIPPAAACIVVSAVTLFRHDRRSLRWATPAIVGLLLAQTAYTSVLGPGPGLSTAGRVNLEQRFFPAVYGFEEDRKFISYRSDRAKKAGKKFPKLSDKLAYVASHPASTWKAFKYIVVHENLLQGSRYVKPKPIKASSRHQTLYAFSERLNLGCAYLHALALPFVVLFAVALPSSRRKWIAMMAYLGAALILLPTCLVYYQGDRTILVAAPLWLGAYAPTILASLQWLATALKTGRELQSNA